jgi:hypothetical protein
MLLILNAEDIIQLPELKKMERFCTTLGELMTMASWGLEHSKANLIQYKLKEFEAKIWFRFSAGASFTLFLDEDGELYGCGNNEDSNLGVGDDF